jgi:hypothetical protein
MAMDTPQRGLTLTPEQSSELQGMIVQAANSPPSTVELEVQVAGLTDISQFKDVVLGLPHGGRVTEIAQLDVIGNQIRASAIGAEQVKSFLTSPASRAHMALQWQRKSKLARTLAIPEFNLRCTLKEEQPLPAQGIDPAKFMVSPALTLRLKRRISIHLPTHSCRVDLTAVKMVCDVSLQEAVRQAPAASDRLECEVEFLPPPPLPDGPDKPLLQNSAQRFQKQLLDIVATVLCSIRRCHFLLSNSHTQALLAEYDLAVEACSSNLGTAAAGGRRGASSKRTTTAAAAGSSSTHSSRRLIGPQLVTLMRNHLVVLQQPSPAGSSATTSVLDGTYCVTDKTDGERVVVLASRTDSGVFIIDDRMNIRHTGLVSVTQDPSPETCLLDAEWLPSLDRVILFDVYLWDGQCTMHLPLMVPHKPTARTTQLRSRLELLQAFLSRLSTLPNLSSVITLGTKEFHTASNPGPGLGLLAHCRDILAAASAGLLPYSIDGLVFMPFQLPVGASFELGPVSLFGRWERAFKWKPPSRNTIDFLVRREEPTVSRDPSTGALSLRFGLFVGAPLNADPIDPLDVLLRRRKIHQQQQQQTKSGSSQRYGLVPFRPANLPQHSTPQLSRTLVLPLSGPKQLPLCLNNDLVSSGVVVECSFKEGRWVANSVRKDKTERYRASGASGGPNNIRTAMSVWRSIMEPVTEDMVSGTTSTSTLVLSPPPVTQSRRTGTDCATDEGDDDDAGAAPAAASPYYTPTDDRARSASIAMRTFHNHVKQSRLINFAVEQLAEQAGGSGRVKVCELACGRGGELAKWLNAGVLLLLGLDVNRHNLYSSSDSAYSRLLERLASAPPQVSDALRVVFLPVDVGRRIDLQEALPPGLCTNNERMIASVLWATVPTASVEHPALQKYYGIAKDRFHVVSCQFSVHYFCRDLPTLQDFCANVASFLLPGGLFVGTCMDGSVVHRLFEQEGVRQHAHVHGSSDDHRILWFMKRMYSEFSQEHPEANVGLPIEVFLETFSQPFREYLVDLRLLTVTLGHLGLELLATGSFQDEHAKLFRTPPTSLQLVPKRLQLMQAMHPQEKRFSFLNRWFVYRKLPDDHAAVAAAPKQ